MFVCRWSHSRIGVKARFPSFSPFSSLLRPCLFPMSSSTSYGWFVCSSSLSFNAWKADGMYDSVWRSRIFLFLPNRAKSRENTFLCQFCLVTTYIIINFEFCCWIEFFLLLCMDCDCKWCCQVRSSGNPVIMLSGSAWCNWAEKLHVRVSESGTNVQDPPLCLIADDVLALSKRKKSLGLCFTFSKSRAKKVLRAAEYWNNEYLVCVHFATSSWLAHDALHDASNTFKARYYLLQHRYTPFSAETWMDIMVHPLLRCECWLLVYDSLSGN